MLPLGGTGPRPKGEPMSLQRGVLPTLTEVIEIDAADLPQRLAVAPLPPESIALENLSDLRLSLATAAAPPPTAEHEAAIPAALEERVLALLAPRLARLVDTTLQSVRTELALEVQVLVRQSIDEALVEQGGD